VRSSWPLSLGVLGVVGTGPGSAQSVRDYRGAPPVLPLDSEPPPRLFVDPPVPGPLVRGLAVIVYRTENLHIAPVFGPNALDVTPRIGHIHVTVDDLPWHWADASGEPLIIKGLLPGSHKVLIELVNANHVVYEGEGHVVEFVIPQDTSKSGF
jgi:Family of unknown function (DUF6130)